MVLKTANMEQQIKGNKEENASKLRAELNILFTVREKKKSIILICKLVCCFLDQNCLIYVCYHEAERITE